MGPMEVSGKSAAESGRLWRPFQMPFSQNSKDNPCCTPGLSLHHARKLISAHQLHPLEMSQCRGRVEVESMMSKQRQADQTQEQVKQRLDP